ncbi:uncharacterized protein CC84DRAFT_1164197, partial [Paraphaeosphaeria sporulosa]
MRSPRALAILCRPTNSSSILRLVSTLKFSTIASEHGPPDRVRQIPPEFINLVQEYLLPEYDAVHIIMGKETGTKDIPLLLSGRF